MSICFERMLLMDERSPHFFPCFTRRGRSSSVRKKSYSLTRIPQQERRWKHCSLFSCAVDSTSKCCHALFVPRTGRGCTNGKDERKKEKKKKRKKNKSRGRVASVVESLFNSFFFSLYCCPVVQVYCSLSHLKMRLVHYCTLLLSASHVHTSKRQANEIATSLFNQVITCVLPDTLTYTHEPQRKRRQDSLL